MLNRSMLAAIRSGLTDFGMTTLPRSRCQRKMICAGETLCFGCDLVDRRIVEQVSAGERAPRLGDDAVLVVNDPQLGLLQTRMQLHLVDRGDDLALVDEALQMRRAGSSRPRSPWTAPASYRRSKPRQVSTYRSRAGVGQWIR